jgi:DNA-binding transcriptional LysR family regulator
MIGARHFQCVIALAEALNFTVAAQRLHIAQPALSQTIQQIENELGVRLFERHTRKVALTAAGKVLYREARTTLEHIERAARMTQTAAKGEAGDTLHWLYNLNDDG